jgi:putative endopeptidase
MPKTRRKEAIPAQPYIPESNNRIKPGDNFYMYVNANWLRHASIPPYLSSYGVSEEIEDIIKIELNTILTESRHKVRTVEHKNIPHTTYLLGTLAESTLNPQVQDNSIRLLQSMVTTLNCIRDVSDVGSTLADFMKHRIPTVLNLFVAPMEQDSKYKRLIISTGSFGLPDSAYYKGTIETSRILGAYAKLLARLGTDFGVEDLHQTIGFEQDIARAVDESHGDSEVLIKGSELQKIYKHIPWEAIFQTVPLPHAFSNQKFVVISKKYLKQLNQWFHTWTIHAWKLLLAANMILFFLPLLPPPYDDLHFELYQKRLRDQTEKTPQKLLALKLSQQWLGASLGSLFIQKYVSPEIKQLVSHLAVSIRASAARTAKSTPWLSAKTQEIAETKVRSIYLGVAYPNKLQLDKKTQLSADNLLKNVLQLASLDFSDQMLEIDTPLRAEKWDDDVFSVNAYYYNEGNRLILPAGILRWPFFHPAASDGWNYGGLGATIGHEISHAFDNDGKDFDQNGNLNPWWTKEESAQYQEKTKDLIQLYDKTEYFGAHLNGVLTLSENIADLGGISIALNALKQLLVSKNVPKDKQKEELCYFFISYAVSWRTKEKKIKALQSLFMDVHAPPPARVNNIVCQFDEWYECFNVQPGDALYKDPKERIRIF